MKTEDRVICYPFAPVGIFGIKFFSDGTTASISVVNSVDAPYINGVKAVIDWLETNGDRSIGKDGNFGTMGVGNAWELRNYDRWVLNHNLGEFTFIWYIHKLKKLPWVPDNFFLIEGQPYTKPYNYKSSSSYCGPYVSKGISK